MNNGNCIAALFDLDGVIIDTESQYSFLWHQLGVEYLGMDDLEIRVKGQTLTYIYNTFFAGMEREQGATESCAFVKRIDFQPSAHAFDACFEK